MFRSYEMKTTNICDLQKDRGKCKFHSVFKGKNDSKETLNHSLEGGDCSDLK